MTRKITAKKALQITCELWTWLAKNPDKQKGDWLGWEKYGHMTCHCPLCQYRDDHQLGCSDCLVDWGKHYRTCSVKGGLFYKWIYAIKSETRSKCAWGIVRKVEKAETRLKKGDN